MNDANLYREAHANDEQARDAAGLSLFGHALLFVLAVVLLVGLL